VKQKFLTCNAVYRRQKLAHALTETTLYLQWSSL
jgi:hypothetical protein